MIDFMMISQRWRSAITGTRSFPRASIGSDHSLVLGNIRIRFQAHVNKAARPRIDIDKLIKNHLVRENYQLALKNRFEQLEELPEDTDDALEIVNNNIQEAARETIGNRRKKKLPWINDEVLAMTDQRREIKAKLNENPSLKPKYRQLTRNIRAGLTRCQHE